MTNTEALIDHQDSILARSGRFNPHGRLAQILIAVLLIAPALLQALLIARRFVDWQPVWAWYPDPGYQYLFAGGSLITGGTTDLIFHPGTSLQWFIGLSEVLTHLAAGRDSLLLDVATRPEFYAQFAGLALALVYVAALGAASWRMFRHLGLWPAVLFQLLLLWGLPLLASGRFLLWPESLVLTSAVASVAIVAPQLGGRSPLHPRAQAVGLGLVAAVGMTAKVTYLPIVMLVVILLGWRRLALFLVPLIAASLVLMIPVYSRLDSMQSWFLQIATNPGRHGQTGSWNPVSNFSDSMLMINSVVRWFIPVALVIIAASILVRLIPQRTERKEWIPMIALLVATGTVLASGLKDSEARDFILAIPPLAALAAVTLNQAFKIVSGLMRGVILAAALLAGTFLAAHGIVQDQYFTLAYQPRLQEIILDAETIDVLNEASNWAPAYNAWTLDSSKIFGLIWSAGSFNEQVRQINPNALHYELFTREILHVAPDNQLIPLSCLEIQEKISNKGLGIIVESQSHIVLNENGTRLLLHNTTAGYEGPESLGRYFAYRLTDIECKP